MLCIFIVQPAAGGSFIDNLLCNAKEFQNSRVVSLVAAAKFFENLDITENLANAVKVLAHQERLGVYAIKCLVTGALYIGSSINLGDRMKDHIIDSSNIHLKNAIVKYGISAFIFFVVEFVEIFPDLTREEIKLIKLWRILRLVVLFTL